MPPSVAAAVPLVLGYLVGALPFGYLVGRLRGVNLFEAGSGNIGATNAARVLGRPAGALVFLLDFLKGAVPVACAVPLAETLATGASSAFGSTDVLRVAAAALAFLGHLFPVYLGFRGGKGVATGAGTIFVLVPLPAALAVLAWVVMLLASRIVSLASLAAVTILVLAYLLCTRAAFASDNLPVTLYLVIGTGFVVLKHRSNIKRLLSGTESRIGDFPMRDTILRGLHLLALGLWFGGAAFFNFVTAPTIFDAFKQVAEENPSYRTANETILDKSKSKDAADLEARKASLASALAGSAVGPVFPKYFAMQAVCGMVAILTARAWAGRGGIHRWRVIVLWAAFISVTIGWPISTWVSQLRVDRFSGNPALAEAARAAFGPWHLVSLLLSFVTVCLAGASLALAAKLPAPVSREPLP